MKDQAFRWLAAATLHSFAVLAGPHAKADPGMEIIAPATVPAPAVLVISGASGPFAYYSYAKAIAGLGYTSMLVSGQDIPDREGAPADNMKKALATLRSDPRVIPGKVVVIGFSLGGGGALLHATNQPEHVAAVVAYYPSVTRLPSIANAARQVAVPTLILAGEKDTYGNCCLIGSIRAFEAEARKPGVEVSVVAYPDAGHGFNLGGPAYRPGDTADAWARVQALLARTFAK